MNQLRPERAHRRVEAPCDTRPAGLAGARPEPRTRVARSCEAGQRAQGVARDPRAWPSATIDRSAAGRRASAASTASRVSSARSATAAASVLPHPVIEQTVRFRRSSFKEVITCPRHVKGGSTRTSAKRNTQSLLFKRKRFCRFTVAGVEEIDYKDIDTLRDFISENGKITPGPPDRHARVLPAPADHRASSARASWRCCRTATSTSI